MSTAEGLLRRGFGRLRRSMTAQISLSITLVSVFIIAVFVGVTGRLVLGELREENELTLLANLAFLRDDLAASGYDLTQAARLVDRAEARVHWLHAAILDAEGRRVIASSSHYALALPASLPRPVFDAGILPSQARVTDIERLRESLPGMTTTWRSPDGTGYRLLTGRIEIPGPAARPAGSRPGRLGDRNHGHAARCACATAAT